MNVKLPLLPSPRQTVSHPGALTSSSSSQQQGTTALISPRSQQPHQVAVSHHSSNSAREPLPPPSYQQFGTTSGTTTNNNTMSSSNPRRGLVAMPNNAEGAAAVVPAASSYSLVPVSPRPLGEKVAQPLATAVQKRIRMLDNHISQKHVNPIAAWPSTTSQLPSGGGTLVTTGGGGGLGNRAPLAMELENFMRREHRDLAATKPHASELDSLPIYREAFGCLISHFPEYSAALSLIKTQYDATVEELSFAAQRAVKLDMENRSMRATFNMQVVEERESLTSCLHDTQTQLQAALRLNQQQRMQIAKLEHDLVTMEQTHSQRDKLFDESQERIKMLGVTLVEEGTKMAQVVRENHAANTEVHRLQVLAESLRTSLGEAEKIIQVFRNSDVKADGGSMGYGGSSSNNNKTSSNSMAKVNSSSSPARQTSEAGRPSVPGLKLGEGGGGGGRSGSLAPPNSSFGRQSSPSGGGGVTPRAGGGGDRRPTLTNADTDELKRRVFELECSMESLQHENTQLVKENKRLTFRIARLQSETQRDVLTPRPDWDAVQQRLPGFHAERDRSSLQQINDLVNFVQNRLRTELLENERKGYGEIVWKWLEEEGIAESELLHRLRYFIPRGTAPTVPPYLKTSRPVRNRRFNKGNVEAILNQFWNARQLRRKTVPSPTVEEYWYEWSVKETGSHSAAVELSYNILDVCERSQHDPDCRLFLKVLRGELSEMAVYDQSECVARLLQACEAERKEGTRSAMITRPAFLRCIREVFPEKPRDHMTKLRFLLSMWSTDDILDYEQLFAEDADGNQTPFVEMLRRQHAFEVEAFTVDVCETLRQIANEETGMVNVADAMNAVHELDPYLTEFTIQNMFSVGCRLTMTDLLSAPRTLETQLEPLIQRLKFHTLLKRMSPPADDPNGVEDDDELIDRAAWQSRANAMLDNDV